MEQQQQQRRSSDPQTGLEEPMWQLELGATLPERPGEPDCVYYLRTGSCGYGHRCRFHHPPDRAAAAVTVRTGAEFPERIGQPICQYYMRTGTCKFGATCKYDHPNQVGSAPHQIHLNYRGFPLRPGEKECTYYVKTGNCKFGATCKFHHPQPAGLPAQASVSAQTFYPPVPSPAVPPSHQYTAMASWPLARPPAYLPGSYAYARIAVPPGVIPVPGWSPYQPHVSSVVSSAPLQTVQAGSMYGSAPYPLSASAQAYPGPYHSTSSPVGHSSNNQKAHSFPERPGQPDCQFYMRTGDCKYGPSCRYHHPSDWSMPKTNCALNPLGLPLRPGAPPCTFYRQNGVCKFGPTCKFDHPVGSLSYSHSASSLADMPIAPYPTGFSIATLAPSSSSSDLRHEYLGGVSGDSVPIRVPLSGSRSGGSAGSMFSTGHPVSQAIVRGVTQNSIPSSSSSTVHSIEITRSS